MKSRYIKISIVAVIMSIVGMYSCVDLEVENLNVPDTQRVIETPDDLLGVAGGAFRTIINASLAYESPMMPFMTMGDRMTCSWGNAAMKDLSSEPRVGFNNTVPYSYAYVNRDFWQDLNSALSQVNDVLIQVEEGAIIVDAATTELVKTWCYFIQGVVHGYLGMAMQKGFIVDETTDLETLEWSPYSEMIQASVGYLDKAIAGCQANTFILPDGWIRGSNLTNTELGELASFFAAKALLSGSRNATENAAVDWSKVLSYANNGLSTDFTIDFDGYDTWVSRLMGFSQNEGWMRVDMRVINLMDTDYPSRWNANGTPPDPAVATSADARLESDFRWLSTVPHRPERGYYHFSYYGYYRYPEFMQIVGQAIHGVLAVYPKAENDLMKAEASLRTGNKSGAIDIINAGTRVTRGGLPNLGAGATDTEVFDAIYYERDIELFSHSLGTGFFDMRRRNYLQPGTLLHFPIPGKELETLGEDYYSLGSGKGTPGVDFADTDWGWPGWDVQNPYK